jgi:hypothetical protein
MWEGLGLRTRDVSFLIRDGKGFVYDCFQGGWELGNSLFLIPKHSKS